ncbi:hypothetical protein EP7_002375 [Isosphaeraceae bacterium EP7]
MASLRKRGRVWYFRYVDADGVKQERKGCPDKRATEEMARAAESHTAMARAGLIDPKEEAYRRHDARPLAEHLEDWQAAMLSKGRTAAHARLSHARVSVVVELAGAARLSGI